ncbi:MAG: RdgB/HAM1 family non-canonical purine NTP pyrophosphatase [Alphaproteobacteria bacterium]|nr:RdgB/HAM1 family non-canonical purine NTP pyrophosphatase [Alphaproteobacteria bacterium]
MRRSARHEKRLVLASHNTGKLREIADLLRPFHIEVVNAGALGLPEPEETGMSFVENAELKARAAAAASGLLALSDDSGLCVVALHDQPGIYSARWAGPDKNFSVAMQRVEEELNKCNSTDRRAHFVCALSLCWPDGHCETFQGEVHGQLVFPPRGSKGFGYDPIFLADGYDITFGEMDSDAKHAISHRAHAFRQMIDACFTH